MNATEKYKFIWWGTAGCGSRSVSNFFHQMGVDDLYNHTEGFYDGRGRSFTHKHGYPKGKEDWPVICNVRNPYSLVVSSYLDIYTESKKGGIELSFEDYLKNIYFTEENMNNVEVFYLNGWDGFHKEPDYIIHMETMEEDLRSLPFFNDKDKIEDSLSSVIRVNQYKNGSPYDEYIGQLQKYQRFYTQDIADYVYGMMEPYFTKFGYDKDSWKL